MFLPCKKKKKKIRGLNVEDLTLNKISIKRNFLLCPTIPASQDSANTPSSLETSRSTHRLGTKFITINGSY